MRDLRTRLLECGQPLLARMQVFKRVLQWSFLFFLAKGLVWTGVFAYVLISGLSQA